MKTFVWLIGKPGSGKTTIGDNLAKIERVKHFSYGDILKQVQPNPPTTGYESSDRDKVNQLLISASREVEVLLVCGNPYSGTGFGPLSAMENHFDRIVVIHLLITDEVALKRLLGRSREVLSHDGKTEKDRVDYFNTKLLPLIEENKQNRDIHEIDVTNLTPELLADQILRIIKPN